VHRVLHYPAATVDVVPTAVPVLGEGLVHRVVKAIVRHDLMQPEHGAGPCRAPQQLAPRKFASPFLHI
jgi:hypothetical protein